MNEVSLAAEPRQLTGSAACRRLRAQGRVPGVIYGRGMDAAAVTVDAKGLRLALSGPSGLNALLALDVAGTPMLALARQLQRGVLRGGVDHVDFLVVDPDVVVAAEIPIRLVGEAIEVHRANGLVEQQLFDLPVLAKPGDIPTHVEVDVSSLDVGDTIHVSDLPLPAGVEATVDGHEPVVSGVGPRTEVLEGEEEEAAEPVEDGAPAGTDEDQPDSSGS